MSDSVGQTRRRFPSMQISVLLMAPPFALSLLGTSGTVVPLTSHISHTLIPLGLQWTQNTDCLSTLTTRIPLELLILDLVLYLRNALVVRRFGYKYKCDCECSWFPSTGYYVNRTCSRHGLSPGQGAAEETRNRCWWGPGETWDILLIHSPDWIPFRC